MRKPIDCIAAVLMFTTSIVVAQERSLLNTQLPAGAIGQTQIARRPELANVWQPVLIRVPDGATLSLGEGLGFTTAGQPEAELVSLQVGSTYRMKVTNIPNNFGNVYPTIELVDRLHAPPGKETRYPVPVEITAEELTMALSGKFVTRVIYVEDPRNAVGGRELPEQRYFEALPDEDPYEVASRIGRPIAILRMGSVLPNAKNMADFLFGSPPLQRHGLWPKQPKYKPSELKPFDLPAEPQKRKPLPNTPAQPDTSGKTPDQVPADLPAKKEIEEQPESPAALDPASADEETTSDAADNGEFLDDSLGDDLFDTPATDADDDDPFEEFE